MFHQTQEDYFYNINQNCTNSHELVVSGVSMDTAASSYDESANDFLVCQYYILHCQFFHLLQQLKIMKVDSQRYLPTQIDVYFSIHLILPSIHSHH